MGSALTVIAIFWLASGEPAFDYLEPEQCRALQTMTERQGAVELELADGTKLTATRMECRAVCPDETWMYP